MPNPAAQPAPAPQGAAEPEPEFDINPPKKEADAKDTAKNEPTAGGEVPAEAPEEGAEADGDNGDTDLAATEGDPAAQNFKRLRTKLRETSTTLNTYKEENEKVKAELEKFKTGEVVPDLLQEKENEIARLSRYEKLHNLKMSPAYQEKYLKPLGTNQTKLKEIAKDYGIPDEHLDHFVNDALSFTNRADLNRFLSDHFDEVGAMEVKDLISKTKDLQGAAREAEKEPVKMLQEIESEYERVKEIRHVERVNQIRDRSKDAWTKSLQQIRAEGRIEELIFKDNDPEHNEKWAKPIVTKAAQEYGKLVTMLATECGIENLPDEVAYALARMTQLAHASAAAVETRNAAMQYANELETNTRRTSGMVRPPIGSAGAGSNTGAARPAPASPTEAAEHLISKVLGGR